MKNQRPTSKKATSIKGWLQNPAFRLGYQDKRCYNPYSPQYDTMTIRDQYFYEYGRLTATHAPAAAPAAYQRNFGDLTREQLSMLANAFADAVRTTPIRNKSA